MNPHFYVLYAQTCVCSWFQEQTLCPQDLFSPALWHALSFPGLHQSCDGGFTPQEKDLTLVPPDFSSSVRAEFLLKWILLIAELGALWGRDRQTSGRPVSSPVVCITPISRLYCCPSLPMTGLGIEPLALYQNLCLVDGRTINSVVLLIAASTRGQCGSLLALSAEWGGGDREMQWCTAHWDVPDESKR